MNQAAGMPCPVCNVALVMSDRQGIEIDYCPQCRGVWLDRGELDKIIERSAAELAPAPARAPQQPQHQGYQQQPFSSDNHGFGHGYGHKKRKKSFFEEIFD
jgi:uncharacterized protein